MRVGDLVEKLGEFRSTGDPYGVRRTAGSNWQPGSRTASTGWQSSGSSRQLASGLPYASTSSSFSRSSSASAANPFARSRSSINYIKNKKN